MKKEKRKDSNITTSSKSINKSKNKPKRRVTEKKLSKDKAQTNFKRNDKLIKTCKFIDINDSFFKNRESIEKNKFYFNSGNISLDDSNSKTTTTNKKNSKCANNVTTKLHVHKRSLTNFTGINVNTLNKTPNAMGDKTFGKKNNKLLSTKNMNANEIFDYTLKKGPKVKNTALCLITKTDKIEKIYNNTIRVERNAKLFKDYSQTKYNNNKLKKINNKQLFEKNCLGIMSKFEKVFKEIQNDFINEIKNIYNDNLNKIIEVNDNYNYLIYKASNENESTEDLSNVSTTNYAKLLNEKNEKIQEGEAEFLLKKNSALVSYNKKISELKVKIFEEIKEESNKFKK